MNKQELINIYSANKQKMQPIVLNAELLTRDNHTRVCLRCFACAGIIYASGLVNEGRAYQFKPASRALGNINEIVSVACPFCGQHHHVEQNKITAQIKKLIDPGAREFLF